MNKIDKLTINLNEWGCGENSPGQLSKDMDGTLKYCCLGLLGRALGAYQHNDFTYANPDFFYEPDFDQPERPDVISHVLGEEESEELGLLKQTEIYYQIYNGTLRSNDAEHVLATINDDKNVDEETRRSWIRAGFKHWLGIDVTFEG